jgi:glutathione S-transferase
MSEPKIILYQPPGRPFGLPNLSPFCVKLECYLRMAGVPYEVRPANMLKAPKGKIPYVDLDGQLVGDSQLVIERLERTRPTPLDAGFSPEARAVGHAVRRMLEEGLYFVAVYLRWARDDGFAVLRPEFVKLLPPPLRMLLPLIRRKVRKSLHSQGTGRHSDAEIQAMGMADLTALAAVLGERPFLMGERPGSWDATVYAFMESIGGFPLDSDVRRHLLGQANLVAYRDRVRAAYWA